MMVAAADAYVKLRHKELVEEAGLGYEENTFGDPILVMPDGVRIELRRDSVITWLRGYSFGMAHGLDRGAHLVLKQLNQLNDTTEETDKP